MFQIVIFFGWDRYIAGDVCGTEVPAPLVFSIANRASQSWSFVTRQKRQHIIPPVVYRYIMAKI